MNYAAKIANLDFLINFTKGDKEKIIRYVDMYLTSTPSVLEEMKYFFNEGNLENVRLKAHSIKPQVQYMGISDLGSVLIQIEAIISQHGDTIQLEELIHAAEKINIQASGELSEFISKL